MPLSSGIRRTARRRITDSTPIRMPKMPLSSAIRMTLTGITGFKLLVGCCKQKKQVAYGRGTIPRHQAVNKHPSSARRRKLCGKRFDVPSFPAKTRFAGLFAGPGVLHPIARAYVNIPPRLLTWGGVFRLHPSLCSALHYEICHRHIAFNVCAGSGGKTRLKSGCLLTQASDDFKPCASGLLQNPFEAPKSANEVRFLERGGKLQRL